MPNFYHGSFKVTNINSRDAYKPKPKPIRYCVVRKYKSGEEEVTDFDLNKRDARRLSLALNTANKLTDADSIYYFRQTTKGA